ALAMTLTDDNVRARGSRVPSTLSALRGLVALYVPLEREDAPVFAKALARHQRVSLPRVDAFGQHSQPMLLGAASMVVCYALFYISTVCSLSYGVATLRYTRETLLGLLCFAVLLMAAATPLAALASDRFGRKPVMIAVGVLAILSGLTV
ncbi:MFS transporter, partial [Pseudomonas syringae]